MVSLRIAAFPLLCVGFASAVVVFNGSSEVLNMSMPIPDLQAPSNPSTSRTKVLRLVTLVSYGNNYLGPTVVVAQQLALNWLHNQSNWLPGYRLEYELVDDGGNDEGVVSSLITKLLENDEAEARLPLFGLAEFCLGSQMKTAYLMDIYNALGVSSYPMPEIFLRRQKYKNYIPTGERQDYYTIAAAEFIRKMGWKRAALLTDSISYSELMEPFILDNFEANNISLAYMGKFRWEAEDEYEMNSLFEELQNREPRIFLVAALRTQILACYFHKYKLFGPGYVLITYSWQYVDENTPIASTVTSWCTREMILEVLPSFIYFGDAPLTDIYGEDFYGLTGVSNNRFVSTVKSSVDKAEESGSDVGYWTGAYYDKNIVMGVVLNITEAILNSQNETLSDWTTDSSQFKEKPRMILDAMRQAIGKVSVTGLKGEYTFDPKTNLPSGSMPIVFTQMRVEGTTSSLKTIGYYKSNQKPERTTIMKNEMFWRTVDGSIPKDHLTVIKVQSPIVQLHSSVILMVTGGILIITIVVCGAIMRRKFVADDYVFTHGDLVILVSDIVFVSHAFAIPLDTRADPSPNCLAVGILLTAGFSGIVATVGDKLERCLLAVSQVSSKNVLVQTALSVVLALTPPICIAAALTCSPITSVDSQLELELSASDISLAFQHEVRECAVIESLMNSTIAIGLAGSAALFLTISLLRATMLSFKVHSLSKRLHLELEIDLRIAADLKRTSLSVYVILTLLLAGAFIGLLIGSTNAAMIYLTSSLAFAIVGLNIVVILLGLFKKVDIPASTLPRNNSSRLSATRRSVMDKSGYRAGKRPSVVSRRSTLVLPSIENR